MTIQGWAERNDHAEDAAELATDAAFDVVADTLESLSEALASPTAEVFEPAPTVRTVNPLAARIGGTLASTVLDWLRQHEEAARELAGACAQCGFNHLARAEAFDTVRRQLKSELEIRDTEPE